MMTDSQQNSSTTPNGNQEPTSHVTAVAHEARDEAASVVSTAREEVGQVADEVRRQAVDLVQDAREEFRHHASSQTDRFGEAMAGVGEHLHALADGRPDDAGRVASLADDIANQVDMLAQRVNDLGFDGVMDELQRYARRRPGAFLAGAAALGFAASRLVRGANDQSDEGGQGAEGLAAQEASPASTSQEPSTLTLTPPRAVSAGAHPSGTAAPAGVGSPFGGMDT